MHALYGRGMGNGGEMEEVCGEGIKEARLTFGVSLA